MSEQLAEYGADKALSVANKIQHGGHEPPREKEHSSDSSYWNDPDYLPEGMGAELNQRARNLKIKAKEANLNLFEHKGATFFKPISEEVKKSGLSTSSKNALIRYAGFAWELRADTEDDKENYFFLRDDVVV